MARKPQPGGDRNAWGQGLNEYLDVSHETDGTIKPAGVQTAVTVGVETALAVQLPPAVADAVASDQTVVDAAAAAVDAEPRVSELISDMATVNIRIDDVEPAALMAKGRVIDLSEYVDISGTSDSTAGFIAAIADHGVSGAAALYLRAGASVRIQAGEVFIPDGKRNAFSLIGDGQRGSRLVVSGTGPAFQLDPNTTPDTNSRRQWWRLENIYFDGPGKSVSGSVGVHINNGLMGYMSNVTAAGFETGIHVDAHELVSGAATYYNDFFKVAASGCGTAFKFSGQANSNRLFGGSARLSDIGIHMANVNNVVINGMDIEANSQYGVLMDAYQNQLLGVRFENPSALSEVNFTDSTSGGLRGRKNTVLGYWTAVNPSARLGGGALVSQNYIPTGLGYHEMGDVSSTSMPYGAHLSRSAVADGKPLVLLEDTNSTSGSPTGIEYRYARPGSKALVASSTSGDERIAIALDTSGRPYIAMTNSVTGVTSTMRWLPISPEGVYAGNIGDAAFVNNTSTGVGGMYVKQTGSGNTGWVKK